MRSSPSLLSRALEPVAAGMQIAFLVVSAIVAPVWAFGVGDAHLEKWIQNPDLVRALLWLWRLLDFGWVVLAGVNIYASLAAHDGLAMARKWSGQIILAVLAVAACSVFLGFPLGHIQYSAQLGPKIGPVPMGLPLLWLALILGAREAALRLSPKGSHAHTAILSGALILLTDFNLEPAAARLRGWWFWRADVAGDPPIFTAPLITPLVWGCLAWLMAFLLRENRVVASVRPRSWMAVIILLIFNAVFLISHLGRWWRG